MVPCFIPVQIGMNQMVERLTAQFMKRSTPAFVCLADFFFTISKFLEFLTSDGDGILINVIQMVTQDNDYKSSSNYSFIEFVFVLLQEKKFCY